MRAADQMGIHYAWSMEHHFLEEYSHSSAPEVFLAAASQVTSKIRLGHGVVLALPEFNHPARVAERIATLDLLSNGRVEFGAGEGASRMELEGFGIDPAKKKEALDECLPEILRMLSETPYGGFNGKSFRMPQRNVVPKPLQTPHPPLWLACSSRESIRRAARIGAGALTFVFSGPEETRSLVDEYYKVFKEECVPVGKAVNPNIAVVVNMFCGDDSSDREAAQDGFDYFAYALGHYYMYGAHKPGRTQLWDLYEKAKAEGNTVKGHGIAVGTPADLRRVCADFEASGVDQLCFIQLVGRNTHHDMLKSLETFGSEVLPVFEARNAARDRRKKEELAPFIEKAFARVKPVPESEPVEYPAYGWAGAKGTNKA